LGRTEDLILYWQRHDWGWDWYRLLVEKDVLEKPDYC
jgi:hypothetical protein